MTLTVKLEPDLEQALDARSAALKQPKSLLVREALRLYLRESASPFDLGRDLFARHAGPLLALFNQRDSWQARVFAGWKPTHAFVWLPLGPW